MPTPSHPSENQRLLALLSASNTARHQTGDETAMLQQQCRLLVETGGFRSASLDIQPRNINKPGKTKPQRAASYPPDATAKSKATTLKLTWTDAHQGKGELHVESTSGDFTAEERMALQIIADSIGETLLQIRQDGPTSRWNRACANFPGPWIRASTAS